MSDLDRYHTQQDARRAGSPPTSATRYGAAVNRYLAAVGYRPEESAGSTAAARTVTPVAGLVVVGADDTPTSYTAVDHAAIEAELHGWMLRIVLE